MKNPWLIYLVLRLGTFALITTVLILLQFHPILAASIAAMLALTISLFFFGKQRDAASSKLYQWRNESKDADGEVEDELADRKDA